MRLASHGLDPTDPLTVATLTVTLVEAIPAPEPGPVISKAYPNGHADEEGKFRNDDTGETLEGERLAGATVTAKLLADGEEISVDLGPEGYEADDDRIVIAGGDGTQWAGIAAQAGLAGWVKPVVNASGKSAEIRLTRKA